MKTGREIEFISNKCQMNGSGNGIDDDGGVLISGAKLIEYLLAKFVRHFRPTSKCVYIVKTRLAVTQSINVWLYCGCSNAIIIWTKALQL